jgi:hypothetical protein
MYRRSRWLASTPGYYSISSVSLVGLQFSLSSRKRLWLTKLEVARLALHPCIVHHDGCHRMTLREWDRVLGFSSRMPDGPALVPSRIFSSTSKSTRHKVCGFVRTDGKEGRARHMRVEERSASTSTVHLRLLSRRAYLCIMRNDTVVPSPPPRSALHCALLLTSHSAICRLPPKSPT